MKTAMRYKLLFMSIFVLAGCASLVKPTPAQLSARMSIINDEKTKTVFYLTKPNREEFPIAVLCEGSSSQNDIASVWQVHQFEQFRELSQMGIAILTVEKDGIDAEKIDNARFFANYTRSKRFHDHIMVIDHLLKNPPNGFDGRLIFVGASEGGPIANQLSIHYPQTIATINWSASGYWPWPDELWAWAERMRKQHPFFARLYGWWNKIPRIREEFDHVMEETLHDPSDKRWFLGMTYRYHADAIKTPTVLYEKIHAPILVVCGTKDSLIESCDDFAKKSPVSAPITYWRIEGMEHPISKNKQNIIPKSFEWMRPLLKGK
jgi:pimeloyl-ACP methyl ester carboxylesterase